MIYSPALYAERFSPKNNFSNNTNLSNRPFQSSWMAIQGKISFKSSFKILSMFEEHREYVKLKAARNEVRKRDERCIADGNELLRFHYSTFVCDLGINGNSSLCTQQYCSICGIIRSGFSAKMNGILTLSSIWRAHVALPDEIEEEFAFMNVKRAILVCRVVAGHIGIIGCDEDVEKATMKKRAKDFNRLG
ncbi:PREDICTED: uncharacterized protein LOC104596678 [Nelumbo nucifera]|uniref:Uncharacterized protein LOC104596678 n=2 Tax=Nelumbo nucifera TaxID=4432 RepID=A0A1U8A4L5_NELNU|nr:PREDICTED: uncharacterized protein LOC104596678 [Nelumbo nucifera]DAD19645.1 TPA_asm: hypothetical protein HUJ06_021108 [Nelumbo nucifera]